MDNQQALLTASRENFEAQCNLTTSLGQTVLTGLAKLIELNMSTMQTALIESAAAAKQYLSTDPKEWLSLAVVHCQPAAGKAFDYARYASKIVSETQTEFNKTAELEIAETNSKILTMVDAVAKSATAGIADTPAHLKVPAGKAAAKPGLVAAA